MAQPSTKRDARWRYERAPTCRMARFPMSAAGAVLSGQVALVTGATRGIGRAIALALGGAGADVIGTATTDEGAASISSGLREANLKGEGVRLDVRDTAALESALRDI